MDNLRASVRPIIFETGLSKYPLATRGTSFLLGYKGAVFILTARHVIEGNPVDRLRVYPTDRSKQYFHLSGAYYPFLGARGEDVEDFALITVDLSTLQEDDRKSCRLIHLTDEADQWEVTKHTSKFFSIGFPEDHSYVDYDARSIHTGQVILEGSYVGYAGHRSCHTLRVNNPMNLRTFSGMSGGPVFSLAPRLAMPANLTFCGIALRGTPTSSKIHFLEAKVIRNALEKARPTRSTFAN